MKSIKGIPIPYKIGMGAYRFLINSFFSMGGLRHLKRKYSADSLAERMGRFSGVPQGGLWVHAVSVGEVQSASALIRRIDDARPKVLSTVTETGREMARQLIGRNVDRMIYSPWDAPHFVRSALDTLKPAAYIAMETERWPEMLFRLKERGIPAFLVNGRLSESSLAKLRKTPAFWGGVLSCFTRILVRFEEDKAHFAELGVPDERLVVTGDCKVDALLDRRDALDAAKWSALRPADGSPLFIAGSTHQGEDEVVLSAFRTVREHYPNARLVIVPRHPERALMVIAESLKHPDLRAELLSKLLPTDEWDVLVADRIGVLFELYSAADAAFVGGSLVPKGGQNPLEPAIFGIITAHGPSMTDFPDTDRMDAMGAAQCIMGSQDLADVWLNSISPSRRECIRSACRGYYDTIGGAALRSWEEIKRAIKN